MKARRHRKNIVKLEIRVINDEINEYHESHLHKAISKNRGK